MTFLDERTYAVLFEFSRRPAVEGFRKPAPHVLDFSNVNSQLSFSSWLMNVNPKSVICSLHQRIPFTWANKLTGNLCCGSKIYNVLPCLPLAFTSVLRC